jgi:pyridoxine 4-dehydrogenase
MRILWAGPGQSRAVLRRALELGVTLIDTADVYGAGQSEMAIADALHPYPDDLVIATKGGQIEVNGAAQPNGRPAHLRAACEASLRRLRLDTIDLYQLHNPDPDVPLEESLGTLLELQQEGKIRRLGVSNVFGEQLELALDVAPVVSLQNLYNVGHRRSEPELRVCERRGVAFMPYSPLGAGTLAEHEQVAHLAAAHDATSAQVALAWLLTRSPMMLPIPGTTSIEHLEENVAAATLELSEGELVLLETPAPG